jgi:hypothetical protein
MRFYPRAVWQMCGSDYFCMQQPAPNGPPADLASRRMPPLEELTDRTLSIHCMMVGSASNEGRPYRRTGIAHRMAQHLVDWAQQRGWQALETAAFEDLDLLYAISGLAGRSFWEKMGFQVIKVGIEPAFAEFSEYGEILRKQAAALGLPEGAFCNKYTLRLEL